MTTISMSIKTITRTSVFLKITLLINITFTNKTASVDLYLMTNQANVALDLFSIPYMWMLDFNNSLLNQIRYGY
jgi:hypothetical protein